MVHKKVFLFLISIGLYMHSIYPIYGHNQQALVPLDQTICILKSPPIQSHVAPIAVHLAAAKGDVVRLRSLIADGKNIQVLDENKITPLHIAAAKGHLLCVQELINVGAKINVVT